MKRHLIKLSYFAASAFLLVSPLTISAQIDNVTSEVAGEFPGNVGWDDITQRFTALTGLEAGDLIIMGISSSQSAENATYSLTYDSGTATAVLEGFDAVSSTLANSSWITWATVSQSGDAELQVAVTGTQTSNVALAVLRPSNSGYTLGAVTDTFDAENIDGTLGAFSENLDFSFPQEAVGGSSNYVMTVITTNAGAEGVDSLTQSPTLADASVASNLKRFSSESSAIDSSAGPLTVTTSIATADANFNLTGAGVLVYATGTSVEDPTWAGYPKLPSGDVNTESFLGWLNVVQGDYVWSYSLDGWIYLPEEFVGDLGAWMYIPSN